MLKRPLVVNYTKEEMKKYFATLGELILLSSDQVTNSNTIVQPVGLPVRE